MALWIYHCRNSLPLGITKNISGECILAVGVLAIGDNSTSVPLKGPRTTTASG